MQLDSKLTSFQFIQSKVTFNSETGEGTIEWAAEDKDKAAAAVHPDAEAGVKMRTTKWQTMM